MSKQSSFGLIAFSILLAVSPLSLLAGELPQANPLQGRWVFNIPETVEALKYADLTDEEHRRFSTIFKPAELQISSDMYSTYSHRGETHTPYEIHSVSEDGRCFTLQLKDTRIPLDIQKHDVCLEDDKLILVSYKNIQEIYHRKTQPSH